MPYANAIAMGQIIFGSNLPSL